MVRWVFLIICLWPWIVLAGTPLDSQVAYLEDPSAEMPIEAVRQADQAGAFTPYAEDGSINFGLTDSAYWLRFTLEGADPAPTTYLIEVAFYALTDVALYYPDGQVVKTGKHQPAGERPWPHRHLVFPVNLTQGTPEVFYLRVASDGSLTVPLRLWTTEAFASHTQHSYLWIAAYYGAALALLFYNFLLFVSLKDRKYLLYCGFLFFTGSAMFLMNGFAAYALAPLGWPETIGTNTFYSLAAVFAVWFLRDFLDTPREMPRIDWLLLALTVTFGLIAVFPLFDVPVRIGVGMLSGLGVITGPILIGVSVLSYWRGHLGARFLLLAWTVLLAAVSIQAARNFDLIPTNALTSNLLQVGSLLDMLLLSFALADRINAERRARELAQDRALLAQTELVEVLRGSEQRLEETVKERTAEIESALTRERAIFDRYVEFGALIAHEFRNPLAIIVNQAQLGQMSQRRDKDPTQRLKMIERAAVRLQHLFEQWLQSDRLQDGQANLALQSIDLSVWLPEMLAPEQMHIKQPIECWADELTVTADKVLLGTALYNLIDNAAKYSPESAVIQVRTVRDHDRVGIEVTDTGPGIPEAEQMKIFDKHYRASENTSSRGLGIGLYFTRQIMQAHGGEVTVASHPGSGSAFTLWLPMPNETTQPTPDRL
ncbi:hypothetical protein GH984_06160 [Spiribacter sp. C176]|uniref:histidine kinase n=1 Tax=Spiribacter salilacus TaxID=2664894 RepID=A0A6N7QP34_9GAMM|nr:sensor histidine kinase [Spiribacter salilacus]MRH78285.1 hypothetical protein [Spiribacter salilacus]